MLFAFPNVEAQLMLWMLAMVRPGAAFLAAPVFGAASVPVQLRILIALAIALPATSNGFIALPTEGMASLAGVVMIISEAVIGLAIGFTLQIAFTAALLAGEAVSNSMGLGFAAMTDPASGQPSAAIGQLLSMLATFLLLALDGHLLLVRIMMDSFAALPPGQSWLSFDAIKGLIDFGGLMFAAGLAIALPVGFAMVLVQIMMAMIARSAPTLNLFAVGMPASLLAGVILLAMAAPTMADGLTAALDQSLQKASEIAGGR